MQVVYPSPRYSYIRHTRLPPRSPKHCVMMVCYSLISQLVSLCLFQPHAIPSVLTRDVSLPPKFVKNKKNPELFRSDFSTFWLTNPKCIECDLTIVSFFLILGHLTLFGAEQTPLVLTSVVSRQLHRWQEIRRCHHASVKTITLSPSPHPMWSVFDIVLSTCLKVTFSHGKYHRGWGGIGLQFLSFNL